MQFDVIGYIESGNLKLWIRYQVIAMYFGRRLLRTCDHVCNFKIYPCWLYLKAIHVSLHDRTHLLTHCLFDMFYRTQNGTQEAKIGKNKATVNQPNVEGWWIQPTIINQRWKPQWYKPSLRQWQTMFWDSCEKQEFCHKISLIRNPEFICLQWQDSRVPVRATKKQLDNLLRLRPQSQQQMSPRKLSVLRVNPFSCQLCYLPTGMINVCNQMVHVFSTNL